MTQDPDLPQIDDGIPEYEENPIPWWLKLTYISLPIWGVIVWYFYWNGSSGWLDRGYWQQLQEAAKTTFIR